MKVLEIAPPLLDDEAANSTI